jgi:hypothetical protein
VRSTYGVFVTSSLWGIAILQVSQESIPCDILALSQWFI